MGERIEPCVITEAGVTVRTSYDRLLAEDGYVSVVAPRLGYTAIDNLREAGAYVIQCNGEEPATAVFMLPDVARDFVAPSQQPDSVNTVAKSLLALAQ
jgi:hypothetical protein